MGVAPAEIEGGDGTTLATVDSFSTGPVVREHWRRTRIWSTWKDSRCSLPWGMTRADGSNETRGPRAIDAIAEDWVTTLADLGPDVAVWIGIPGRNGEYADHSPAGHEQHITAAKKVIAKLEAAEVVDDVTRTDLLADLRLTVEAPEAGLWKRDVSVIASPAQDMRNNLRPDAAHN